LWGITTEGHRRLLILPADFSSRTQRAIWNERSGLPRRPIHYHHLPPTVPFAVAAAHIVAIRPRVVIAYGSWTDQFLRWVEASRKPIPAPRLWLYISDRLSPEGRQIAEAMGCAEGPIESMPEQPGLCVSLPGHIGIYVGDGMVIESTATLGLENGVVMTRLDQRPWTHWLQCGHIQY
jgi:hypothetical protein